MYKGEITITLKSDLCTGSGYSYAGIVDSDICYDEVGLPYIPGKRLKGCFREVAESSLYNIYDMQTVLYIFGEAGNKEEGKLRVGNAYICNYDQIKRRLKGLIVKEPELINSQAILSEYSHVIGQTEISEKGVAEKTSLRFTRAINHYDPLNIKSEMTFVAEIQADVDEKNKNAIEDIVRCTRNIGLKRNRGMGSVVCSITLDEQEKGGNIPCVQGEEYIVALPVVVENTEPLMLSGEFEDVSESYIKGQALLGLLAGRYLKTAGKSAEDDAFYDMFLNGKVRYSNLYPCAANEIYYPVPEYINKLKKTKKIVNVLCANPDEGKDSDYNPADGNQPKKIKGSYARIEKDMTVTLMEVKKEIVYHHSHYKKNEDGDEGILYGMEVVSPGQCFKGYIYTPEKYVQLIKYLLHQGNMYFGKSRSSQYGCTVLIDDNKKENVFLKPYEECIETTSYRKGESVVIDFQSDTVFLDQKNSEYTVYEKPVYEALIRAFEGKLEASDDLTSYLKTGKITGYSGVWNLRKQPVPCIKSGSCVVMNLTEDCELPDKMFIGERQIEGCGQISLRKLKDMNFRICSGEQAKNDIEEVGNEADVLYKKIKKEHWLQLKKKDFLDRNCPDITASGLGRITLMLKESLNESDDYNVQYRLFCKRIESIKTDGLKSAGKRLLRIFGDENNFTWLDREIPNVSERDEYSKLWGNCLMTSLVIWKYEKAGDDNE